MRARLITPLVALHLFALACTSDEPAVGNQVENATEKGLLGLAPPIAFGTKVTGAIKGKQLDAWGIDLKGGDKITVVEKVTSGNLKPDAQLFLSGYSKLSSAQHSVSGTTLTKSYVIETTGRYYFAVRAYQGQGEGDYSLEVTCTGGPCNGEPVVDTLDDDQAGDCVARARACAFDGLGAYDGNVGPVRARQLFEGCLATLTIESEGLSCKTACDEPERKGICDGLIGLLPFYADQSAACIAELDECLEVCSEDAGGGLVNGAEHICLLEGLNGTCDSFARGHADCGGSYTDDSNEECHAFCESTFGAWNDDLDTICTEQCD
jgi:hypothetical protein